MKHVHLPDELLAKQTPFEEYLYPTLTQVKAEGTEKELLGSGRPYNRQIP
jgi:hypothetical protein